MPHLTLFELNNLVRRSIDGAMSDEYWVEAELSEVRESKGHCYMELVQNDPRSLTPIARASAKCWRQTWLVVRPHFEHTTGETLHRGMKLLLRVYPQFHEAYGFSWIVTDIDPTFTLGDMARRRMEIVRRLKSEGVFDLNKSLHMPLFAQHIAVVSSPTAAGYGDFCRQLEDNDYGFRFAVTLFPAVMQGEQTEQSVVSALNQIYGRIEQFDCVVIIRGGGAVSDMSGFDTLVLAENVANFPLPVITGIGHDRDETVIDMVAHTRVKTPTAAAAFLVANLKAVADRIDNAQGRIQRSVTTRIDVEKMRLSSVATHVPTIFSMIHTRQSGRIDLLANRLRSAVSQATANERHRLSSLSLRLLPAVERRMTGERHRIALLEQRAKALDPRLLLQRGYSVTLHQGRIVRRADDVPQGGEIVTIVAQGTIKSVKY